MVKRSERGFSIIELVLVVVVIGIIATIAIPFLAAAVRSAENGNTFATMRTIASTEVNYYQQNSRFGRITEINNVMAGSIGTQSGNTVTRGKFNLAMTPAAPSDAELKTAYIITATRNVPSEGVIYVYEITQTGWIRQILP